MNSDRQVDGQLSTALTTVAGVCRPIVILTAWAAALVGAAQAAQPPDVVTSDANGNTAMGHDALFNLSSGYFNTASGVEALFANTSGYLNTATGGEALSSNTTGYSNTAIGANALWSNTSGGENTATGSGALDQNIDGGGNTATGANALYNNNGSFDTATGAGALYSNTANYNTATGFESLYHNTTGNLNTATGHQTLLSNIAGSQNTAMGFVALGASTGSNNIGLGAYAGGNVTSGSENIEIGSKGAAGDNKVIRIGTPGTQTKTYIAGISGAKVTGAVVYVTSSGQLGVLASSERYKTAVTAMGARTERLQALRPVTFHLKSDPRGARQYGLIAEEVAKVYPELVIRDDQGRIEGVRYDELAPMLLNELQKEQQRITRLEAQLSELHALKAQMSELQELKAQLVALQKSRELRAIRVAQLSPSK